MVTAGETADDLRAWGDGYPWIRLSEHGSWWLDLETIPANVAELSGGERAYLLIAASIGLGGPCGGSVAVNLSDTLSSLDRRRLDLALAAAAYAGGRDQRSGVIVGPDGAAAFIRLSSLHPWPERN
jgi:hypothetical protein